MERLPQPALGLLPAAHDATVESYTTGALPTVAEGAVFQNNSGGAITLPAYGPWPAQSLAVSGYAACDGRFWYPARRYKATNSYYPAAFERTIYTLGFSPESLSLGETWTLRRKLDVRLIGNNTTAVWNFVWEIGMRTDDTTPAPVGPNIEGFLWREPLIDQQIHMTDVVHTGVFGVQLARNLADDGITEVWSGSIVRYNKELGAVADQLPTGKSFVLRLRMSCFDIEDDVENPRGYAAYFCGNPEGED